ncbi:hypothetical protein KDH_75250 [Dictyobacter sp. S3.2.2.5]|uniref:Uncharacterized protein n=1 Tax=Dictyobacter halimunensis TaxID=3026934 RepID=A0ABQ6G6H9_9CHLR|nr:hypothetical protein KDH_75250 [Dictyobacter sp. S3.2.2.5]
MTRNTKRPCRVDLQRSTGPLAAHIPGRFGFSWKTRRPTWYPASNVHFWVRLATLRVGTTFAGLEDRGKRCREGTWAAVAGAGSPVDR